MEFALNKEILVSYVFPEAADKATVVNLTYLLQNNPEIRGLWQMWNLFLRMHLHPTIQILIWMEFDHWDKLLF